MYRNASSSIFHHDHQAANSIESTIGKTSHIGHRRSTNSLRQPVHPSQLQDYPLSSVPHHRNRVLNKDESAIGETSRIRQRRSTDSLRQPVYPPRPQELYDNPLSSNSHHRNQASNNDESTIVKTSRIGHGQSMNSLRLPRESRISDEPPELDFATRVSWSSRKLVTRGFVVEDIGKADHKDIAGALVHYFGRGSWPDLARILESDRWFEFIVTLKGSEAQAMMLTLQYVILSHLSM